mgnify:CR=1 FL=1
MNILQSSDWHAQPDEYKAFEEHLDYIETWLKTGGIFVGHEHFNALENGWKVYERSKLLARLVEFYERYPEQVYYLNSNHAKNCPWLPMKDSLVYDHILFRHGHQFDGLWFWLSRLNIPDWLIPDWLVKFYRTPGSRQRHLNDFHVSALAVRDAAEAYAIKHGYRGIAIGHNHLPSVERLEILTYGNSGDWIDSFSWLEIDTDHWLWRNRP